MGKGKASSRDSDTSSSCLNLSSKRSGGSVCLRQRAGYRTTDSYGSSGPFSPTPLSQYPHQRRFCSPVNESATSDVSSQGGARIFFCDVLPTDRGRDVSPVQLLKNWRSHSDILKRYGVQWRASGLSSAFTVASNELMSRSLLDLIKGRDNSKDIYVNGERSEGRFIASNEKDFTTFPVAKRFAQPAYMRSPDPAHVPLPCSFQFRVSEGTTDAQKQRPAAVSGTVVAS